MDLVLAVLIASAIETVKEATILKKWQLNKYVNISKQLLALSNPGGIVNGLG
jgi:hypothetical protein